MIPQLAILAVVIRSIVEGVKRLFNITDERVIKVLVYLCSAAAVWYYRLDVLANIGMKTPYDEVRWIANALVLAVATMGTHDVLDKVAGR